MLNGPHHRWKNNDNVDQRDCFMVRPVPQVRHTTERGFDRHIRCLHLGMQHKKPTKCSRQSKAWQTIEEVCTRGRCCANRHPTTRNKPNTTHAPLRLTFPETAQLIATSTAPRLSKQPKARSSSKNAPNDAHTKERLQHKRLIKTLVSPPSWHDTSLARLRNMQCFEVGSTCWCLHGVAKATTPHHRHISLIPTSPP